MWYWVASLGYIIDVSKDDLDNGFELKNQIAKSDGKHLATDMTLVISIIILLKGEEQGTLFEVHAVSYQARRNG